MYRHTLRTILVPALLLLAATTSRGGEVSSEGPAIVRLGARGLEVESESGDFSLRVKWRLHVDAAFYGDDSPVALGNGTEVRRARLEFAGSFWDQWTLKAGMDFAGNEVELKSNYIRFDGFKPLRITLGLFKESFGLERLTSSNDMVFMERAAMNAFAPGRNVGIGLSGYGDVWSISAGIFGGPPPDEEDEGEELDESWGAAGRLTFSPVHDEGRVVHLGAAVSHRRYDTGDSLRWRARPESHVTDERLVNTGTIEEVDHDLRLGAELAVVFGPLTVQGEYVQAGVERSSNLSSLSFAGWYGFASWLLTGESREYNRKKGVLESVAPGRVFGAGGAGAWELGVRYSHLDLSDGAVVGGKQSILTLGLNWYLNPNLRFMANYVHLLDVERPGSQADDQTAEIFQLRTQVHF